MSSSGTGVNYHVDEDKKQTLIFNLFIDIISLNLISGGHNNEW